MLEKHTAVEIMSESNLKHQKQHALNLKTQGFI